MTELLEDVSKQADALGQAFKDNRSETLRLQVIQKELEAQWSKEKSEFDELVLLGNSLVVQLCVLEDEKTRKQRNIVALEKDIETRIQEFKAIQRAMIEKRTEYEDLKRKMTEYVIKMDTYQEDVGEAEDNTPLLQQIRKIKQDIQALQEQKAELKKSQLEIMTDEEGNVKTEDQLRSEVTEIKQQIKERKDAYQEKKKELGSVLEKRKGLEMTSFVLKKKNSALLIRMTRKVEERKEKYSSLVTQRDYLRQMIEMTNRKLERFGTSACL